VRYRTLGPVPTTNASSFSAAMRFCKALRRAAISLVVTEQFLGKEQRAIREGTGLLQVTTI